MTLDLPAPISDYFAADRGTDTDAVALCFSEDAVVIDEGHTHSGRQAIRDWKANASTAYTYTVEPFRIDTDGDQHVVTSHLTGTFPGSPVDLRYAFTLTDGLITTLEIAP